MGAEVCVQQGCAARDQQSTWLSTSSGILWKHVLACQTAQPEFWETVVAEAQLGLASVPQGLGRGSFQRARCTAPPRRTRRQLPCRHSSRVQVLLAQHTLGCLQARQQVFTYTACCGAPPGHAHVCVSNMIAALAETGVAISHTKIKHDNSQCLSETVYDNYGYCKKGAILLQ